ncbi:hypothetical protein TIFTF001_040006 [Ficus carica]|uniref:Uncharacterized protein n=1 Tax=Ficus carica TaxID=3494 RepID=A0AA87YZL2_FICCA|nr:hypothetical protein TIFTF001_039991 [Ficus carica]GMN20992.1 hypothetical protein TIFTF001_039994 [Ficus carica]GMN21008.1 hypothetical protein TIFTF001_040003 [Ficus carica]GMN21031.1 hypothetical protein TIFTF001_040006 [Ficus carica]
MADKIRERPWSWTTRGPTLARGRQQEDPPPLRADRARRNQNKYCNFHKDVGHDTKDCIQLRDQIELLIRDGHLREFVERIITPAGSSRPAQAARRNPRPSDQTDEQEQEHIVHTIFGGTATGDTPSSRRSYVREARHRSPKRRCYSVE